MVERLWVTTCKLGVGQTLTWGSAFYLPAILAHDMGRDLATPAATVFAAFSTALLLMALVGPMAGRLIDRWGGRPVLMATNLIFAIGLIGLSQVRSVPQLFAAWLLLGVAMGAGLYEASFATVVRLHGQDARRAITGITLFGGFASTVSWPVTTWLLHTWGWREACLAWAGVQLLVLLPLHASLPGIGSATASRAAAVARQPAGPATNPAAATPPAAWATLALMALSFASVWFMGTSMMSHLPNLLVVAGATTAGAVTAAALVGPAQVLGRILDYGFLRRAHPLWSARVAIMAYPLAAAVLVTVGAPAAWLYAVIFGLGNGVMTVAMGTLPLAMFGPQGYGQRQGLLMIPARIAQSSAPFLFGLAVARWQVGALWIFGALATAAATALWTLKPRTATG